MIGPTLAHYKILEKIGSGGMGDVYLAEDTRLDRKVALKVLPPELAQCEERRARFKREAKAIAALNHPNIVTLYAVEEAKGVHFITMELVNGKTLRDAMTRPEVGEPLSGDGIDAKLRVAVALADAVACAHEKGIIHRDLKPENVMVTDDGRVKILDFGLATFRQEFFESAMSELDTLERTKEGHIVGTIAYMSPEQAEGKRIDPRTDIFSLGTLLYELFGGALPFRGDTATAMMSSVVKDEPAPLAELRPELPRDLNKVVHRCLVKDPERRCQSAKDLRNQLEEVEREVKSGDSREESAPASAGVSTPGRRLFELALVGLASALFAGTLTWWVSERGSVAPLKTGRWTMPFPPGVELRPGAYWGEPIFAISPDGKLLAYIARRRGEPLRVYLRPRDRFDATPVAGSEGATTVFFSHDSQWLAFQTEDGMLWKASVSGGAPLAICRTPGFWSGSWGLDDTIVFDAGLPSRLWRVPAAGGEPEPMVAAADSETSLGYPYHLPDGEHLLFVSLREPDSDIEVMELATGRRKLLLHRGTDARALYLPTGHLLIVEPGGVFAVPFDLGQLRARGQPVPVLEDVREGDVNVAVSSNGTLLYTLVSPAETTVRQVAREERANSVSLAEGRFFTGRSSPPRLSPDGKRVALVGVGDAPTMSRQIVVIDLERQAMTRLTQAGANRSPIWSPDGSRIAFQSNTPGAEGVFLKEIGGSGEALPLAIRKRRPFPDDWSPDGRILLFEEGGDLFVVSETEEPSALLASRLADERDASLSPDGRFFAFTSNNSGRDEVYVQPFPSGPRKLVSIDGGESPVWVGEELFYRNGSKFMVARLGTEPELEVSRPRLLFERDRVAGYDVTSDGQAFVTLETGEAPPLVELNVVENFLEELKLLVPTDN